MALHISESEFRDRLYTGYPVLCVYDKEHGYLQVPQRGQPVKFYKFGLRPGDPSAPTVSVDDPRLSLSNFRVGFFNNGAHTYLLRLNSHSGSFGYTGVRVSWTPRGSQHEQFVHELSEVLHSTSGKSRLKDVFTGGYPSFKDSIVAVTKNGVRSIAFDRELCLVKSVYKKNLELYHRNRLVGHVDPKSAKVTMFSGPLFKLIHNRINKLIEGDKS